MNYSIEYLTDKYKKSYDDALRAYKYNNLIIAKEKFLDTANYLEQLAKCFDDNKKDEYLEKAKRVRKVAKAIVIEKNNVRNNDFNENVTKSHLTNDNLNDDSIREFITFYTSEDLNEGFDTVIGLNEAKEKIYTYVINPRKYKDEYNYNFLANKAILLEGPPGTGKTTFAKAVAKEIEQPFALVNVAALINCYIGETGKNIDKIFQYLRDYVEKNKCGVTVFFDELDEIAKKRGGDDKASESAVPALLRNLDGVKKNIDFLIIGNTNLKESLDPGILDRFAQKIYIPLPNKEDRKQLFQIKLKEIEKDFFTQINLDEVSELTEGLSGRDITYICNDFKYKLAEIKAFHLEKVIIQEELVKIINIRISQK